MAFGLNLSTDQKILDYGSTLPSTASLASLAGPVDLEGLVPESVQPLTGADAWAAGPGVETYENQMVESPTAGEASTMELLSSRGMFNHVYHIFPPDVDGLNTKKFYEITELEEFIDGYYTGNEKVISHRLILLQTLTREHRSTISPEVYFNDRKVIYTSGHDFVQANLKGIVMLGPLGMMSSEFVRILEEFFDKHSLGSENIKPVEFRESDRTFEAYLVGLAIGAIDPDFHTLEFSFDILFDPKRFTEKGEVDFTTPKIAFIPKCSIDKFPEVYREPFVEVDAFFNLFADYGVTRGSYKSTEEAARVVAAKATQEKILQQATRGHIGTVVASIDMFGNKEEDKGKSPIGGFFDTILSGTVNLAKGYVQNKANKAVDKALGKLTDKINLPGKLPGTLGNQVGTYVQDMAVGGIRSFANGITSSFLGGMANGITGNVPVVPPLPYRALKVDAPDYNATALKYEKFVTAIDEQWDQLYRNMAPGKSWVAALRSGSITMSSCHGFSPTSAVPHFVPAEDSLFDMPDATPDAAASGLTALGDGGDLGNMEVAGLLGDMGGGGFDLNAPEVPTPFGSGDLASFAPAAGTPANAIGSGADMFGSNPLASLSGGGGGAPAAGFVSKNLGVDFDSSFDDMLAASSSRIASAEGAVASKVSAAASAVAAKVPKPPTLAGAAGALGASIGGAIGGALSGITGAVSGALDSALGAVSGAVSGAIGSVTGAIGGAVSGAVGAVTGAVGGVVSGATNAVSGAVSGVAGAATDKAKSLIPGI